MNGTNLRDDASLPRGMNAHGPAHNQEYAERDPEREFVCRHSWSCPPIVDAGIGLEQCLIVFYKDRRYAIRKDSPHVSMLFAGGYENTVSGIVHDQLVLEPYFELALKEIADMVLLAPVRLHIPRVFNKAQSPMGDCRDWTAITKWAAGIAAALKKD